MKAIVLSPFKLLDIKCYNQSVVSNLFGVVTCLFVKFGMVTPFLVKLGMVTPPFVKFGIVPSLFVKFGMVMSLFVKSSISQLSFGIFKCTCNVLHPHNLS